MKKKFFCTTSDNRNTIAVHSTFKKNLFHPFIHQALFMCYFCAHERRKFAQNRLNTKFSLIVKKLRVLLKNYSYIHFCIFVISERKRNIKKNHNGKVNFVYMRETSISRPRNNMLLCVSSSVFFCSF